MVSSNLSGYTKFKRRYKPFDDPARKNLSNPYDEWHGAGPPPPQLGELGDVYIDTTEGKEELYAKDVDCFLSEDGTGGWTRWKGPTAAKKAIKHPNAASMYLECNGRMVGWVRERQLTVNGSGTCFKWIFTQLYP
jgi:hypothetical protein